MLSISWQITLLALVLLPVFVLPARRMGTRLARLEREAADHNAAMGTQMTERFSAPGATLVKLFGRPDEESAEFAAPGRAGARHRRPHGHGAVGLRHRADARLGARPRRWSTASAATTRCAAGSSRAPSWPSPCCSPGCTRR